MRWATPKGTTGLDDYAASGLLTFAPGELRKAVFVQVKGDTTTELTEWYKVNLTDPTYVVLSQANCLVNEHARWA